jgi:hypothetical protein
MPSRAQVEAAEVKRQLIASGRQVCPGCRTEKSFAEFSPDRRAASGYSSWCHACGRSHAKERRARAVADAERERELAALADERAAWIHAQAVAKVKLIAEQIDAQRTREEQFLHWLHRGGKHPDPVVRERLEQLAARRLRISRGLEANVQRA